MAPREIKVAQALNPHPRRPSLNPPQRPPTRWLPGHTMYVPQARNPSHWRPQPETATRRTNETKRGERERGRTNALLLFRPAQISQALGASLHLVDERGPTSRRRPWAQPSWACVGGRGRLWRGRRSPPPGREKREEERRRRRGPREKPRKKRAGWGPREKGPRPRPTEKPGERRGWGAGRRGRRGREKGGRRGRRGSGGVAVDGGRGEPMGRTVGGSVASDGGGGGRRRGGRHV